MDVLECPRCQGRLRIVATITQLEVQLSWALAERAETHEVVPCDASAGPCTLAPYDVKDGLTHLDADVGGEHRRLWYRIRAANRCGIAPGT